MTKLNMARQILGLKIEHNMTLLKPEEINVECWARYARKALTRKELKSMLNNVLTKIKR